MAPGNISKITRRPAAANVRAKALERVAQMEKEEGQEKQQKIEEIERLLRQKDEELEALTNDQLKDIGFDEMDVDTDEDGNGHKQEQAEGKAEKTGGMQGEEQANQVSENLDRTAGPDDPMPSIEQNQGDSSSENLFVPETDAPQKSDLDSATFSDPELGRALYSRPGPRSNEDAETVGWAQRSGRTTLYLNRYGKKSAASYRLEKFAQPAAYEDSLPTDQDISNSSNRLGDMKEGKKWKYRSRHIKGIFGIAWKGSWSGNREDDLDLINPGLVKKWTDVPTYILIAWDLGGGTVKKCWETRSTLRSRWGTKEADVAIYEAAVTAEERYIEAHTGKRRAISRSPSVGLAQSHVDKQRAKSIFADNSAASRSATPGARAKTPMSPSRMASPAMDSSQFIESFLKDYLHLMGVSDFRDLSKEEKRDCLGALREEREVYLQASA